jgi:hypothetical protein
VYKERPQKELCSGSLIYKGRLPRQKGVLFSGMPESATSFFTVFFVPCGNLLR